MNSAEFKTLKELLLRVPGILGPIHHGSDPTRWWVKFAIDLDHRLAWRVVQELGHILNYLSPNERLPTAFMPVSPPPDLNGGPRDHLAWLIEGATQDFDPASCAEWLESRLPQPLDDAAAWELA